MGNREIKKITKEQANNHKPLVDAAINIMSANMSKCIKALKEEFGISSREISRRTGISIAVISDMEGNKYLPKMEVLIKLACGMKFDIGQLLEYLWTEDDAVAFVQNYNVFNNTNYSANFNNVGRHSEHLPLDELLQKEGLTKNDVKEVIEFIEFKKARKKRR